MAKVIPLNPDCGVLLELALFDVDLFEARRDEADSVVRIAAALLTYRGKRRVVHYVPEYGDGAGTAGVQQFITSITQRKLLRRGEKLELVALELDVAKAVISYDHGQTVAPQ